MDPLTGAALIASATSLYGQSQQNAANANLNAENMAFQNWQNWKSRRFNKQEAKKNREFQESMFNSAQKFNQRQSNTQVQRQMRDMKKAGINPILAGQYGGNSAQQMSAPSGATASSGSGGGIGMIPMESLTEGMVSSARSAAETILDAKKTSAETRRIEKDIEKMEATKNLTNMQKDAVVAQIYKLQLEAETEISKNEGLRFENAIQGILLDFYESHEWALLLRDMHIDGETARSIINGFFSLKKPKGGITINK